MKILFAFVLYVFTFSAALAQQPDSVVIKQISDEIFTSGECYRNLEYLCKKIGNRLSGSAGADKAVEWTRELMTRYGFDKVYLQEMMVPHWERGAKESAKVTTPDGKEYPVNILALGGSIATPAAGLTAEVIEVKSFDELKSMGKEKIAGKIVFYNYPFDQKKIMPFDMYGLAARYRTQGAVEAARLGAVASVTRSMTPFHTGVVNTGGMHYRDTVTKIPACALSTRDSDWLAETLAKQKGVKFSMKLNCKTHPDKKSFNVIGEITGTQFPDEIIVVGGHLDSWDQGEGAHDDGAGCMQSVEVLRALKAIGVRPKRTIRAVMFMNEENGVRGGEEYARQAELNKEKHVMALESDAGGFTPRGFTTTMKDEQKAKILGWKDAFLPYGVYDFARKGGGVDIGPLGKQGVPLMGLSPDNQRYFIIHHTELDTFEQVNKRELELGAIVMTMMVYLVSEYGL